MLVTPFGRPLDPGRLQLRHHAIRIEIIDPDTEVINPAWLCTRPGHRTAAAWLRTQADEAALGKVEGERISDDRVVRRRPEEPAVKGLRHGQVADADVHVAQRAGAEKAALSACRLGRGDQRDGGKETSATQLSGVVLCQQIVDRCTHIPS